MVAAWHLILGDHGHWQHLAEWSTVMWIVLDGIWQWKGITLSLIQWLGQVRTWCNQTAEAFERQQMRQRADLLKEKLDDRFPGSGGLLFNICKWKGAWQPKKGSVSKKLLPADPQEAVQQEEQDWRVVWQHAQQLDTPFGEHAHRGSETRCQRFWVSS